MYNMLYDLSQFHHNICRFCNVLFSIIRPDFSVNRYSRTRGSSDCLQLAVLTVPTEFGDQGTAKMPLTWGMETRESAVSATIKKMP